MITSKSSVAEAPGRSSTRVLTGISRVLFALVGLVSLAGGIYFTFFASAEEGGVSSGADWGVAFWSLSMSVAYLIAAIILSANRPGTMMFGLVVAGLHLVFGVVKLIGYQEYESVPFFAADLAIVVILVLILRRPKGSAARSGDSL